MISGWWGFNRVFCTFRAEPVKETPYMLQIKIFLVGNLDELNFVRRQALPRPHMTKVSNTFWNWFTVWMAQPLLWQFLFISELLWWSIDLCLTHFFPEAPWNGHKWVLRGHILEWLWWLLHSQAGSARTTRKTTRVKQIPMCQSYVVQELQCFQNFSWKFSYLNILNSTSWKR